MIVPLLFVWGVGDVIDALGLAFVVVSFVAYRVIVWRVERGKRR